MKLILPVLLCLGVVLGSCAWLDRQASRVGVPANQGIEKITSEVVPGVVHDSRSLQELYQLNREQIDQLFPQAAELFRRLQETTNQAEAMSQQLAEANRQALAAARRPDGSTDWGAYLLGLGAALMAMWARRGGAVAAAALSASRDESRQEELGALRARLAKLESKA